MQDRSLPKGFLGFICLVIFASATQAASNEGYKDRVMDEEHLRLIGDNPQTTETYDAQGWVRAFRLDRRWSATALDGSSNSVASGYAASALLETPLHGVLSFDSELENLQNAQDDSSLWTFRQQDLPMPHGWSVNNALGVVGLPGPDSMRQASRVYVPMGLIKGESTAWGREGEQWSLSEGRPGRLEGTPTSLFHSMGGHLWNASAQSTRSNWTIAARNTEAIQITPLDQPNVWSNGIYAQATQLALGRAFDTGYVQFNSLTSHDSRYDGPSNGYWLDANGRSGKQPFNVGAYWLEPSLGWIGAPLASDIAGAYGRTQWSAQRWSLDGAADLLRSISKPDTSGYYAIGNARWRYSRDTLLAMGLSLRRFEGEGWSQFTEARWNTPVGQSGLRLDLSHDTGNVDTQLLTMDRSWAGYPDVQYSISLSAGQRMDNSASGSTTAGASGLWAASLSVGGQLGANLMTQLQLSADQLQSGDEHQSIAATLQWRLNTRWSLQGNLYHSHGLSHAVQTLDPLAPPVTTSNATDSSSFYVVLRYEMQAGSRAAPLGGSAREPAGRIEGTVFKDENSDGVKQASEAGLAGAVVYLDRRYPTKTDSTGHFEFPFVVAGTHTLSIADESLPLPWSSPPSGRVITLEVRDNNRIDMPVVR